MAMTLKELRAKAAEAKVKDETTGDDIQAQVRQWVKVQLAASRAKTGEERGGCPGSTAALAQSLGVSLDTLRAIMYGNRRVTLDMARRLADRFGYRLVIAFEKIVETGKD